MEAMQAASLGSTVTSSGHTPRRNSNITTSRETSLSKTVDKVFWVLLRILLSTFVQGAEVFVNAPVPPSGSSSSSSSASASPHQSPLRHSWNEDHPYVNQHW